MTIALGLPDVYVQPRPRVPAPPRVRTDVAGLVGFEPRVRPSEAGLQTAPARHRVAVTLQPVHVRIDEQDTRLFVPPSGVLVLSEGAGSPVAAGGQIVYSVVAVVASVTPRAAGDRESPESLPFVVAGAAAAPIAPVPDDAAVTSALAAAVAAGKLAEPRAWTRLADVRLRRDGDVLWLTVHPRTGPVACEDWRDFVLQLGPATDDGTRLATAVRAFFANGGDRCHIATVRRPFPDDDAELALARNDMVGAADAGVARATGVARLLLIDEVALVAAPDLHAQRPGVEQLEVAVAPSDADADFRRCRPPGEALAPAAGEVVAGEPLYRDLDDVFDTERAMLDAVARYGLGIQLILTPPAHPDPETGRYAPPAAPAAAAWRERFAAAGDDPSLAFAACYWPWLRIQDAVGAPVRDEPPLGEALGIIARRDLARGPFVAPANEMLRGVVATSHAVTDDVHQALYEPSAAAGRLVGGAINVSRPFPPRGIELWGSRTLAADRWMRHLPVRRGVSAIERQAAASLAEVVFEPNTPLLALRINHMMVALLLGLFESGALRGARPEEAFAVRCDDGVNPPESIDAGRFLCELHVAIAAPSEFIVFRLGRQDGAIQVAEP